MYILLTRDDVEKYETIGVWHIRMLQTFWAGLEPEAKLYVGYL